MGNTIRFTILMLTAAASACLNAADYREECLKRISVLEKKFVDLSERVPSDKYAWRPSAGVRSISEVFLHVAGVNLAITRVFGTPPPEGFNMRGFEKSTADKTQITARVRESFVHFRKAIEGLAPADADKAVKMFGQDTTMRGAVWIALEHLSEHLGQSIAYARSNGVAPPWSD
jgi:uncharacterized damage-inducible protein DinB